MMAGALVVAATSFALAGCTGYDRYSGTDGNEWFDDNEPPGTESIDEAPPAPVPAPAGAPEPTYWTCSYDPTMNYDWHDDVLCNDGVDSHRPYLLEWDSFVTEDELMAAALEYENELNASSVPDQPVDPRWSMKHQPVDRAAPPTPSLSSTD